MPVERLCLIRSMDVPMMQIWTVPHVNLDYLTVRRYMRFTWLPDSGICFLFSDDGRGPSSSGYSTRKGRLRFRGLRHKRSDGGPFPRQIKLVNACLQHSSCFGSRT